MGRLWKKTTPKKRTAAAKPVASKKKKPAVKKTVVKKAPAKRKTAARKTPVVKSATTVIAKVDIGYGNHLFMRGDGPGLSWERGILMTNTASDEWMLSADGVSKDFECKVLVNDNIWSGGPNVQIRAGRKSIILPVFCPGKPSRSSSVNSD